jgi:hypothetical protein
VKETSPDTSNEASLGVNEKTIRYVAVSLLACRTKS